MATVTDTPRPVTIQGPEDPRLAKLWALAVAKFEAAGHAPATLADWRAVTRDYGRLVGKVAGPLSQVLAERCAEAPGGD